MENKFQEGLSVSPVYPQHQEQGRECSSNSNMGEKEEGREDWRKGHIKTLTVTVPNAVDAVKTWKPVNKMMLSQKIKI